MDCIKVFCADDHGVVLSGLKTNFEDHNRSNNSPYIELVGTANSAKELLANVKREDIDVFITDLGLESTRGGVAIVKLILDIKPFSKIVVFSMKSNIHTIMACYRNGAKGFVSKNQSTNDLIEAIACANNDRRYFKKGITDEIVLAHLDDPFSKLDEKAQKIFMMIAQNEDMETIQNELNITEKTVNNIISAKIKPILGVDRRDIKYLAFQMGLIDSIIESDPLN